MGISAGAVLKKSENIVFRKIDNEYILVPIVASAADVESIFNLNETGAAIWEKIDSRKSLRNIIDELLAEYEDDGRVEAEAISFVEEMVRARLIEVL